jgi:DNA-binding NarL/FixJ family response regulator
MELIATGVLSAFQILGEWRVERVMLDRLIDRMYEQSAHHEEPADGDDDAPVNLPPPPHSSQPLWIRMTPQQHRIARLVGEGLSNAEIAKRLSVEISTVKSHVSRMLQRLNMDSRQQLIAYLWRTGFLTDVGADEGG